MNIVIKNRLADIKKSLENHNTLSVMGMPGSGISLLLKELSRSDLGYPVYVDVFGLPELTSIALLHALARALGLRSHQLSDAEVMQACMDKLSQLAKTHKTIVIYFAGFDQLMQIMDEPLLQKLQSLARSNEGAIKLVFGLCVSLKKLIPDNLFDTGFRLFGNVYYLGRYSNDELKYYLSQYSHNGWEDKENLEEILTLANGHFQLVTVLLNDQRDISDGDTELTKLVFKNMYSFLLGPQRTILRNIASGGKNIPRDEYLLGIGMIEGTPGSYQLFTPLFNTYLQTGRPKRLPAKERRLFLLLKRNLGQVVSKQQIIDTVWGDQIVSDWALNALVYRLRKHRSFESQKYSIENYKKQGYVLIKN